MTDNHLRGITNLLRQLVTLAGAVPCTECPRPITDGYLRDLVELNQAQIDAAQKSGS